MPPSNEFSGDQCVSSFSVAAMRSRQDCIFSRSSIILLASQIKSKLSLVLPLWRRIFAWKNWGKVIKEENGPPQLALNVGLTTDEALKYLESSPCFARRHLVLGHVHIGGFAFERISDNSCQMTYLTCVDLRGKVPYWAMNELGQQNAKATVRKFVKKFGFKIEGTQTPEKRPASFIEALQALHKSLSFRKESKIQVETP